MKLVFVLLVLGLLVFATGCDTELGHSHEDHDHDGNGISDHTAEEHHEQGHNDFETELPRE